MKHYILKAWYHAKIFLAIFLCGYIMGQLIPLKLDKARILEYSKHFNTAYSEKMSVEDEKRLAVLNEYYEKELF